MQITLPLLKNSTKYIADDFCISESNKLAFNLIMKNFNDSVIYLYGDEGSGKTHLAHIWAEKNNASFTSTYTDSVSCYVVEDLQNLSNEEQLFHLYNTIKEKKLKLLITGNNSVALLNIKLPDLKSRLSHTLSVKINNPDEKLLKIVLLKQLSDRQLIVPNNVINYILKHSQRSFKAIKDTVEKLEKVIPINMSTVRKIIK